MKWEFVYHRQSYNFLKKEGLFPNVEFKILRFIKGEKVDIKKLKGKLKGFLRLRVGNTRIVFKIRPEERKIFIFKAGYRGEVYK